MENIKVIARNKIVHRDYEVLEELECGIVLKGTEIKSVRQGKVSIQEAYCQAKDGKFMIFNMHVAVYDHGNIFNHEELKDMNHKIKKGNKFIIILLVVLIILIVGVVAFFLLNKYFSL